MLKKLMAFAVVVSLIAAGAVFFATRDRPATHPVLRSSTLPALIPTRDFYASRQNQWGYVVNGDGTRIAFRQTTPTNQHIIVQDLTTGTQIAKLRAGLQAMRWHPEKPLLRFIHEGQDWEMDPAKPARANWKKISPAHLKGGWNKSQLPTDGTTPTLVWGKTKPNDTAHVWLVSQDGKEAKQLAEGNARTRYWVFDKTPAPVLRLDVLDTATERLFTKTPEGWRKLADISLNDTFQPLSDVEADGTLLVRSSRGRDKVALVRFNTQTAAEEVIVDNPRTDVGLSTQLSPAYTPDVIRVGTDTQDRVALTPRGQAFLDVLDQFPQPISLGTTSFSSAGRFVTQDISVQSKSNFHILMDLEKRSYELLSHDPLFPHAQEFPQERFVTFKARDGVDIPAILTMPEDVTGPIPFVVYIHGGPALHVNLGFGRGTQFLVNRGYGVLSVNFRGSTGFGKAFQAKGFRQYGRAMQDDIADAAQWLVNSGKADTDALVAMGISYGGYAAAMAMTRDAGLFDAAIVEFPMLDVEFQTKQPPGFWREGMDSWWRYFGRINRSEDLALMREYSPVNRIADLHGPVMVMGGMRDQITAIKQVQNFEKAALEADKDVQVHYFSDAGHSVQSWRDLLRRARLIEEFLAAQAGGRSGGFEPLEWSPAFID